MSTNTTKQRPPYHIGILGGMGPQASALLHSIIIKKIGELSSINECHEYPLITHVSIPAKDFISNPELRHENTDMVKHAVKAMQVTPLDQVIIACNTAHLLIDEIPELQDLPLVSLPECAANAAAKNGATKIGLLASPTTIKMKLYEKYLSDNGCEVMTLDEAGQDASAKIIRRIIAGESVDQPRVDLRKQIQALKDLGADTVILGCTELSVIMYGADEPNVVDALSATADKVVSTMAQKLNGVLS